MLSIILTILNSLYVCMAINNIININFVDNHVFYYNCKAFVRKPGSSSVILLALMNIRAYGSKALQ